MAYRKKNKRTNNDEQKKHYTENKRLKNTEWKYTYLKPLTEE
jgi:hypothetical protein